MTRKLNMAVSLLAVLALNSVCVVRGETPVSFNQRNSPENLAAAGQELLNRTFLAEWPRSDFDRGGRWAELKEVRKRIDQMDYAGALELFKRYTFSKLRDLDGLGLEQARANAFTAGVPGAQWIRPLLPPDQNAQVIRQADDLLRGVMEVDKQAVNIGEPGAVDWASATAKAPKDGQGWPYDVSAFDSLLGAYILTGKPCYLERWAAYADDWALNQHAGVGKTSIAEMPDHWSEGAQQTVDLFRYLGSIASLPEGVEKLPAGCFARVLTRMLDDYIPTSIIYHRSNPQNWTDGSLVILPYLGYLLDEYHIAPQLLRESKRRVELLTPTRHLLDGGDLDSTVGYGSHYLLGAETFLRMVEGRQTRIPDRLLPQWEKEQWRQDFNIGAWGEKLREEMRLRARFLVAHTMANGEWPIGGTRSDRRNRSNETYNRMLTFLPSVFGDPNMAKILALSTDRDRSQVPSYTSERFPFTGCTYIRSGWKATDPYLFMYCAPWPQIGALSWRNNNAVGLAAYGCDLLETGENGTYDQPHTPVRVDDEDQFFQVGLPAWGHRGPMISTTHMQSPPSWRWLDSPRFTLAEGIYAGNFGKTKRIDDVTHQRVVTFVREAGLWIFTDRLESPQLHTYSLDWRFGIQPGHPTDFTPDQIEVLAGQNEITTHRASGANITLFEFPSEPLAYSTAEERSPASNHYRLHDFVRASGAWKAQGASVVVTVARPRDTGGADLTEVKSVAAEGTVGFDATTPRGMHISYRAAKGKSGDLVVGTLHVSGESLLTSQGPSADLNGVVLGCTRLEIDGKETALPTRDFEFASVNGKLEFTPIMTPIDPVKISPADSNVFLDKEMVTLACQTPRTEIRYTTDGGEPTPASLLYTGPITLTGTTNLKTRAFRAGTTKMPETMSETTMSVVTRATFVSGALANAREVRATTPGLNYAFYEGRWQEMLTSVDWLNPGKTGSVAELFDTSAKQGASVFAFRYTGAIEIPKDGVYNFHAPSEFYEPNIMAGYELRIFIDKKEWYPATNRHALGTWSIGLRKGQHAFEVIYADLRADGVEKVNKPGEGPRVWQGTVPQVKVSGPGMESQPIPATWFFR